MTTEAATRRPDSPTPQRPPEQPGQDGGDAWLTADRIFLGMLVVFLPLAIASHFLFPGQWTFFLCAVALVPLARMMGEATEVISHRLGPGLGGLMSASFGNAAELIIALAALRSGEVEVVKASITGGIIGNLLLVLGAAILAGGLKVPRMVFNSTTALSGLAMMFLALTALTVPDVFHFVRGEAAEPYMERMSFAIAVILLLIYVLSLVFSLRTHKHLYAAEDHGTTEDLPSWSMSRAVGVLLGSTLATIVVAEFLVHAIEPMIDQFGLTHTFIGVVVLAIIGGAAENSTAVMMALKNKIDLSFNLAFEASKMIAMFVAPILVLASHALGHPLTLEFTHMEVFGIAVGVGAASLIALDGESNWLEGVMLLGVYAILGVAFFFIP